MVGTRHATRIQKQNVSTSLVSRDVCVSMQHNVDVIRRMIRRYVLQAELQSALHEIDNERPVEITVAVSSDDYHARPDRAKLIENGLGTNVSKVPHLIGAFGEFIHFLRQTVVRVSEHENASRIVF